LCVQERDEILKGICEDLPASLIAVRLGRDRSVVSREIGRNGGRDGYRVHAAQERPEPAYERHYNTRRPHRARDRRPPDPSLVPLVPDGPRHIRLQRHRAVNGLINEYRAAA
jgi:IS30 family transposase